LPPLPKPVRPTLRVKNLLSGEAEALGLRLLEGDEGLEREIVTPQIQKPGLVLAGYSSYLRSDRILIFGGSEMQYLREMEGPARRRALEPLFAATVPAMVSTKSVDPPEEMRLLAREKGMPVFTTPHPSSVFIFRLTTHLEEKLAPFITMHGTMLEVFGVGVLILGESGIGKSECALNLVARGHRLVGDDAVILSRRESGLLVARGKDLTRQHVEVRGLGIVNVNDLFGLTAVKRRKEVDLVIQLEGWKEEKDYERLGLEHETVSIMDIAVPILHIPVVPGRNLAVLIEVAARNHVLTQRGMNPAKELGLLVENAINGKGRE
jgi:HPr kinase/phosphorylase